MEIAKRLVEDLTHQQTKYEEEQRLAREAAAAQKRKETIAAQVARAHHLSKRVAKTSTPYERALYHRAYHSKYTNIGVIDSGKISIQARLTRKETQDVSKSFGGWKPDVTTVLFRLKDMERGIVTAQQQPVAEFDRFGVYTYEPEAPQFRQPIEPDTEAWEKVDELLATLEQSQFDQPE